MIPAGRRERSAATPAGPTAHPAVWLLVLSPAVVLPGGLDRFVLVKALVVALAVAVGLWALPTGRLPRWGLVGLGAGIGWLLLAAITSDAPAAQLWGRWPRYEGLLVLPAYAGALWLGGQTLGPDAARTAVRTLVRAVTVLTGLVGLVAVIEALGGRPLSSTAARPGSLLGNATEQGIVGLLCATVLLVAVVTAVHRAAAGHDRTPIDHVAMRGGALVLAVVTVVLSGSRGALLGLLVAVVVVGGLVLVPRVSGALVGDGGPHRGRREPEVGPTRARRRIAVVVGGVLLGTLVLALTIPAMAARLRGASPLAAGTVQGRRVLWAETIRLVADRPLFGAGPSGFVEAIPAFHTETWAVLVGPANPPDSPHSWLLQAGAAGGVPLLGLALGLAALGLAVGIRALWAVTASSDRSSERGGAADPHSRAFVLVAGLAALSGYAVAAGTHFTSTGTTPLAAFLAGAVIAEVPRAVGSSRRAEWLRRVTIGVVVAWALVLGSAVAAEWSLNDAYRALSAGRFESGGPADAAFARARTLRPWDGDVPALAAHAFASVALAGGTAAAEPAGDWARLALAQIPTSATAIAAASAAAEVTGDLDRAEELMTRLVEREPTNAEWRLRRGVILAGAERNAEAERDFLRAAELAPSSPAPWRNLEVLYGLTGDEAAEREAATQADARAP